MYRERNLVVYVQIAPGRLNDSLARRLAANGLYQASYCPVLYGVPLPLSDQPLLRQPDGVTVAEVANPEEMDDFRSVMRESLDVSEDFPEILYGSRWLGRPGWHPYLARVEGIPAAIGMLYSRNGTGHLTLASTIPAFRRRGCQATLLRHRIAGAYALGCDLVTSGAAFNSISQHNLERAGLRMAFTRADWQFLKA